MIQRIQSIHLLLVVLLFSSTFFLIPAGVSALNIIAILVAVVAFVTILLFKKRKLQVYISFLNFGFIAAYLVVFFYYLSQFNADWKQLLLLILPLLGILFNVLAILAIKKDEALIKSLNRLR